MNCAVFHVVGPTPDLINCFPLSYRSVKCDVSKAIATKEGLNADARHAVADCHACKSGATLEGSTADACHAVSDCYA